jgi:hypothetical protein
MKDLLDPTQKDVALWLKQMDRAKARDGWIAVNNRFQGIARAMRPFLKDHFPDPKEQEAACDGLTLALLTIAHFEDIQQLDELFATSSAPSELPSEDRTPSTDNA